MGKTEEESSGNYKPRRNTNELIYRFNGARIFFPARVCQDYNPGRPTRSPVRWPLDYWTKPWLWRARGTVNHAC